MIRTAVLFVAACVLAVSSSSFSFAIDVYTDEATFLSFVEIESTEDFESFADGQAMGFGQTTVDEVTYSILGTPRNWFVSESEGGNGLSNRLTATFPQPNEITFGGGLTQSIGFLVSSFPHIVQSRVVVTSSSGAQTTVTFFEENYFGFSAAEGIVSVRVESVDGGGNWATIAFDEVSRDDIKIIPEPGDMNGDGSIDEADINPFVLALTDRDDYESLYPWIDLEATGDVNESGSFDLGDVGDFKLLVGSIAAGHSDSLVVSSSVPEPGSLLLSFLSLGMLLLVKRRAQRLGF